MRTAAVFYLVTECELHVPYDEGYLAAFKSSVPRFARRWDQERKLWVIQEGFVEVALQVVRQYFTLIELNEKPQQQHHTASSDRPPTPYTTLHLLADAPIEVVRAAYKALALLHHPDHGGTVTKMQALNAAYEKIQNGTRRN